MDSIERRLPGLARLDPRRQLYREETALYGSQAVLSIVDCCVDRPAPRLCCFVRAHRNSSTLFPPLLMELLNCGVELRR